MPAEPERFHLYARQRTLWPMNEPAHTPFSTTEQEAVEKTVRTRRTIHLFNPQPAPSREDVLSAIDLARWAPNHYLTEPWRFYLLGRETAEAVAQLNASIVAQERGEAAGRAKLERWLEVPGWLVITCTRSDDETRQQEDYAACCCAVQNLQLVLWSRGIGTKWTTGSVTRSKKFFEIIDVDPEREKLVSMLWYGYPADVPSPSRKPVKEILAIRP